MSLFILLLVVSSLCLIHNVDVVHARNTTISTEEDLELDWQLKLRNQTPVKTVETTAGLYDCIDIKKQPALKHPQLQNHEIQMRPTFLPNGMVSKTSSSHKTATLKSVDCPQGTVPIRRYKKEDLIRAKSFSDSHISNIHPMSIEYPGQYLAILRSTKLEPQRGIRATMSLNNPHPVDNTQASMAEMWVQSNVGDQMNGLQAGWIVAPHLNGDDHTHMFILTTTNTYKTSCFNTLCGSFIQTDPNHPVDAELSPVSVFEGEQHIIDLAIIQNDNIYVGYFPADIFTQLTGGGSYIAWGGLTRSHVGRPSPPMGTGYDGVGSNKFNMLGYFHDLKLVDASNNYIDPNRRHLKTYADSHCYAIRYLGKYKDKGHTLFYGGKEFEGVYPPCSFP